MKIFGEAIWGLAKKVLARLVACQRRMGQKKWSGGIDVRRLSGEEWLRLLTETNMADYVGWCARCRTGKYFETICLHCGGALLLFDEQFWFQIGHKIRLAIQKDRSLLSKVKSDRESVYTTKHKPFFPPPLAWLRTLWDQASPPPHQPFSPQVHYQVANWIESLRQLGLSNEEAIEVLSQDNFPDGKFERQGKDYANIPGKDLRKLGEAFRLTVGSLPCSVKNLSEMRRTMVWVDRQRTVPMARLRGERVRKRNSTEG